jgi:hypothetical protein
MSGKNGHSNGNGVLKIVEQLEVRTAERDAAIAMVDKLEAILTKQGGWMDAETQAFVRGARAFLIAHGKRSVDCASAHKTRS